MADGGNNRLGFVECLRLLAALAVFAQHLAEHMPGVPALAGLRQAGPGLLGVLLFFLISGYVVPLSVSTPFAVGPFLARRLFRIYPALLAAFALVWALGAGGLVPGWGWLATAGARTWAANLLLVQDYAGARPVLGVTWTLSVEFAWYGLFALAFHRWGAGAGARLALALPLALAGLVAVSLAAGLRLPLGRLGFLYACALGFLAFLHDRGLLSRRALLGHAALFVGVSSLVAVVEFGAFRHHAISLAQALWPSLAAPALFLAAVLSPRLRSARLVNRGLLPAVGAASYSIYLLHPIGLAVGDRIGAVHGPVAGVIAALAVTGVLAALSYRLLERPGVALGRRLFARRLGASGAVAGGGASAAPVRG